MYRKIGGHSFPWVYSGPIGAILTPQFMGVQHEPALPFASSLCGACGEVCPVKIDIPKILLELRSDVKKAEARDRQESPGKAGISRIRLGDDASPDLSKWPDESGAPWDGRTIEQRAAGRMAEPARSAPASRPQLPRIVEAPLMSRDSILHRVRTALGRGAGQDAPEPPAARIRVPEIAMEARIASLIERVGALAGEANATDDPRAFVAQAIAGKTAVASNAPYLAEIGITALPEVRSGITDRAELTALCSTVDIGITSADYVLADTGTLVMLASPREARLISLLPPGAHRHRAAGADPDGSGRIVFRAPESCRGNQRDGVDHGPEPDGGHRADPGARRPRSRPAECRRGLIAAQKGSTDTSLTMIPSSRSYCVVGSALLRLKFTCTGPEGIQPDCNSQR